MGDLRIVPVSLREAAAFVDDHHRHNPAPRGHKFSIGVARGSELVGVVIVGRPVSRVLAADGSTLEVTRCCTDGTQNACSMLYGAAKRAAFALGYDRLITYTQEDEGGGSLRAAGFRVIASRPARKGWHTASRPRDAQYLSSDRLLWEAS